MSSLHFGSDSLYFSLDKQLTQTNITDTDLPFLEIFIFFFQDFFLGVNKNNFLLATLLIHFVYC